MNNSVAPIPSKIVEIVQRPRESLDIEVKAWLDPKCVDDEAKIARACMALWNNNGGYLLIGFTDIGVPDNGATRPQDVRATYHHDEIQRIAALYASQPIAVEVFFPERDGFEYPVIAIPAGVETPVTASRDLFQKSGDAQSKKLIREHAVYVRSLMSNQTVSTTEARSGDWPRIIRTCFENREADIGAFVRRHLLGTSADKLAELARGLTSDSLVTPIDQAMEYLAEGHARFTQVAAERSIAIPKGLRQVAAIVVGEGPQHSATKDFLWSAQASRPNHTGLPPWVSLDRSSTELDRPYVFDDQWEAFFSDTLGELFGKMVDFWRIDPGGRFYHVRLLEDDVNNGRNNAPGAQFPEPETQLDFTLQISRVTEILSVLLSFARALGYPPVNTTLAIVFRWTGLKGRRLTSWSDPGRMFVTLERCAQDDVTASIMLPLDTAMSSVSGFVEQSVARLFAAFGGHSFAPNVFEEIAARTLARKF